MGVMRNITTAAATVLTASALATASLMTYEPAPVMPVNPVIPNADYAEDHPLFDCRIDGNRFCGPDALVPVPDSNGVLSYTPWQTAPAPLWRLESD